MILITPDEGPSGLSASILTMERQLADMRAGLEETYERIREGDFAALKDATKTLDEIRKWLRIAVETEMEIGKRKSREMGIVNGFAIDFDAARAAIRGRLDRLGRASGGG